MVVDLGQKKVLNTEKKEATIPIDKIKDVEVLNKMSKETNSRGKKQRIKKRIAVLQGRVEVHE